MKFAFFTIPIFHSEVATAELNQFLAGHRIQEVEKQFVDNGSNSFWAFTVTYGEGDAVNAAQQKNRVDYREVLDDDDFAVFARLRDLRKQISDDSGVPVYGIFSNEQLAEMVRQRPTSLTELGQIRKVGKGRLERYGERFLALLSTVPASDDETTPDPD